MEYQTFQPHEDLASFVKCYWTLEIPNGSEADKQRIIPDGCIELAFILGDDIKRFVNNTDFIYQPRAMVLGQITEPFYIEPTGRVSTFAIRFYPYGFSNFVASPLSELANKETALELLLGKEIAKDLADSVLHAEDTRKRIEVVEGFLFKALRENFTIDQIVKNTVDSLFATKGSSPLNIILKDNLSKKRQIERNFLKLIGFSPKKLSRVIRFQAALKLLLNKQSGNLSNIAYESDYYDQAHFIRDFRYFTGTKPKDFFNRDELALSSIFYQNE